MLRRARPGPASAQRGFTLIEMMATVVLMVLLSTLAMPSFMTWVRNARVRAVGDALNASVRFAQAEALRRSRQVVFSLTNSADPKTSLTAASNGSYWSINVAKSALDAASVFVEAGILSDAGPQVRIEGPAAICFSSLGRLATNTDTGVDGAACALPAGTPPVQSYDIALAGADRPLRVLVALGGQVRLCDPAKALSADHPDGCP